jgi:hypothetical protein
MSTLEHSIPCIFQHCNADESKCPFRSAPCETKEKIACASVARGLIALVERLIQKALEKERARVAAEEWESWRAAFGPAAPVAERAKRDVIVSIASARALLALLNKPSS